jgi:hypothetical protein
VNERSAKSSSSFSENESPAPMAGLFVYVSRDVPLIVPQSHEPVRSPVVILYSVQNGGHAMPVKALTYSNYCSGTGPKSGGGMRCLVAAS